MGIVTSRPSELPTNTALTVEASKDDTVSQALTAWTDLDFAVSGGINDVQSLLLSECRDSCCSSRLSLLMLLLWLGSCRRLRGSVLRLTLGSASSGLLRAIVTLRVATGRHHHRLKPLIVVRLMSVGVTLLLRLHIA